MSHLPVQCKPQYIAAAIIVAHSLLLGYSDFLHSPTVDEVAHLPSGILIWHHQNFDLYPVNPPLVKMIAATPVVFLNPTTDWRRFSSGPGVRSEWTVGEDFITANGNKSFHMFGWARLACIPFSIAGAVACYLWAQDLYGSLAGVLAVSFWCMSPNIMGNASLITPDVPAAALGVWAAYSFRNWIGNETWENALVAGMLLGLSELCKFTWIILFAIWPILAFGIAITNKGKRNIKSMTTISLHLLGMIFISFWIINLGYGFQGTFQKLERFEFVSATLTGNETDDAMPGNRFIRTIWKDLPIPLPRNYLIGIDLQKRDFEQGKWSYLRGEIKHGGWWYYYLYALAVKVPVGFWALAAISMFVSWQRMRQHRWQECLVLLLPAFLLFILVSSETGFSRYLRYVIPAFPFMYIWVSQVATLWASSPDSMPLQFKAWLKIPVVGMLAWTILSSLSIYPHSLSYFNELIGGSRNGHYHLIDGNIDWGQDLLLLKRWIDDHPNSRPLTVAYFGGFDESIAGIRFPKTPKQLQEPGELSSANSPLEVLPTPGWHAISVTLLHHPSKRYNYFHGREPITRIGYSINIYHIPNSQYDSKERHEFNVD